MRRRSNVQRRTARRKSRGDIQLPRRSAETSCHRHSLIENLSVLKCNEEHCQFVLRARLRDGREAAYDAPKGGAVSLLETRLDRRSDDFKRNAERMESLVADLRAHLGSVRGGGGSDAVAKHRKRGKLTARERVDTLVDPGSD